MEWGYKIDSGCRVQRKPGRRKPQSLRWLWVIPWRWTWWWRWAWIFVFWRRRQLFLFEIPQPLACWQGKVILINHATPGDFLCHFQIMYIPNMLLWGVQMSNCHDFKFRSLRNWRKPRESDEFHPHDLCPRCMWHCRASPDKCPGLFPPYSSHLGVGGHVSSPHPSLDLE